MLIVLYTELVKINESESVILMSLMCDTHNLS